MPRPRHLALQEENVAEDLSADVHRCCNLKQSCGARPGSAASLCNQRLVCSRLWCADAPSAIHQRTETLSPWPHAVPAEEDLGDAVEPDLLQLEASAVQPNKIVNLLAQKATEGLDERTLCDERRKLVESVSPTSSAQAGTVVRARSEHFEQMAEESCAINMCESTTFFSKLTEDTAELKLCDLINNSDAARARPAAAATKTMKRQFSLPKRFHSEKQEKAVDWNLESNREKLRGISELAEQLFQPFNMGTDADLPAAGASAMLQQKGCSQRMIIFLHSRVFLCLFLALTLYGLIVTDIALLYGYSAEHTPSLAWLNTVVFGLFWAETVLQCFFTPGYLRKGRFVLDFLANISMVGETMVGLQLLDDNAVAARAPRLIRLLRISLRSSGVLFFGRHLRLTQAVPRVLDIVGWQRKQLARILVSKRLSRLIQHCDAGGKGYLSCHEMQFLQAAMTLEFPSQDLRSSSAVSLATKDVRKTGGLDSVVDILKNLHMPFLKGDMASANTFDAVMTTVTQTPDGQRAQQRCEDEVQRVDSCSPLVQATASQIAMKICGVVLLVLIVMPALDMERKRPPGDWQAFAQFDSAAVHGASATSLCELTQEYNELGPEDFLLIYMALDLRRYWNLGCACCTWFHREGATELRTIASSVADLVGKQPHEIVKHCLPDKTCEGPLRSIMILDISRQVRLQAVWSMEFTLVITVLLAAFVIYFTHSMHTMNATILHPLWSLLDDITALQSFRIACTEDVHVPGMTQVKPLEEMQNLQNGYLAMRAAVRSWAKFVPGALFEQLCQSGHEAKIGVVYCDVTCFFSDIDGFEDVAQRLEPKDVLAILERLLASISQALDKGGGTLIKFIGAQVLAVFNAPHEVDNHAGEAMAAFCRAQDSIGKMEVQKQDGTDGTAVRLLCGLHSARILIGNIGSNLRMNYDVLGDGINTASRLMSVNHQYGTRCLVSEDTLNIAREAAMGTDEFVARPIGHLILKGRKLPTRTWELFGREESVPTWMSEAVDYHKRAFELFLQRRFEAARDLLEKASAKYVKNGYTDANIQRLKERCCRYLEEPPPPNWDGTEVLNKK